MRVRIVDAFADRPFAGNPAGVCVLDTGEWPDARWMHDVAAELDLPMTAFVKPLPGDGEADWGLRWFNVTGEQGLCGHATLATAYVLHRDRGGAGAVRLATRSGTLGATSDDDGTITLDFPAATVAEAPAPDGLADALGATPEATYSTGTLADVLAVFANEAAVRALTPDFTVLEHVIRRDGIRGVTATAVASGDGAYDFVSRFFHPGAGGPPEDPVTGSAHTVLAPYWSQRLGRDRLTGFQPSVRTGLVHTAVLGDRVHLSGRAVTVVDGDLFASPRELAATS